MVGNWLLNVEVIIRMMMIFGTIFIQLLWAKKSIPGWDEYAISGAAIVSIFFHWFLVLFKPNLVKDLIKMTR